MMDKLRVFNDDWNGLPLRLVWILAMFAVLGLLLLVLPYVLPFVMAALFAWMIDPLVRFFTRRLGGSRLARGIVSAVLVVLLVAAVIIGLLMLAGSVFDEVKSLAGMLPGWVNKLSADAIEWIDGLDIELGFLPAGLDDVLRGLLMEATSLVSSAASWLATSVARIALRTASLVPKGILFTMLVLVGTFYMSADKERIFGYLRGLMPEKYRKRSNLVRASIVRVVLTQVRASLTMMVITFAELAIGFSLMRLEYAMLFSVIIAVWDALPVLGVGMFLIPMFLYGVVFGNVVYAVGGAGLYLLTIFLRQLVEPRIIGRNLGLYPLATMMAMYAGLHAMGFLGMLVGPMMLLLCKVVLTADPEADAEPIERKPLLPSLLKRTKAKLPDGAKKS